MFSKVVQLYRLLGCPQINSGEFAFKGIVSSEIEQLLEDIKDLTDCYGRFEEKSKSPQNEYKIEFVLPANEHGQFYQSVNDFINKTPTLELGSVPSEFYIVDLNFYSQDPGKDKPAEIVKILKFCDFIKLLSKLASDSSSADTNSTVNRLLFILSADGKSPAKTISIQTKFDLELIKCEIPFLRFMYVLTSDGRRKEMHIEERSMILGNAIAEVMQQINPADANPFVYLVQNWAEVYTKYRHNFQAFLSQYSFEKVRKDIATSEIEYATKLSGVLSDVSGKLLALPVSLAGLVLLRKAEDNFEFIMGASGIVIISGIFLAVLINQLLQVRRLRESFEFVFGQYDDKLNAFPQKFRSTIVNAKNSIDKQSEVLNFTFWLFGFFAFAPLIGLIFLLISRYFVNDCGRFIHDLLFDVCSNPVI